jgi:hypothetical protein
MAADLHRDGLQLDRIEQLGSGDEDDASAGQRQKQAHRAWIQLDIVACPLHRADGDRIGDQPRLRAGLDGEEAANVFQFAHS